MNGSINDDGNGVRPALSHHVATEAPGPHADRPHPGVDPVLELRAVSAGYDGATVLRDVSLRFARGQVTAILGPNGAGKTTLLRVASRQLDVDAGSVEFDGQNVTREPPDKMARRGLCHVPEGRGIFPSLTVAENLALFAPARQRQALERAASAFPILGERRSQVAGSLSGGQQQMLALARAYLHDHQLVLIDEASLGLAPVIVDQVFEFIEGLARAGRSLVIVEQYVHRALAIADHVYVVDRGAVVFDGPPDDVRDDEIFDRYLASA